MIEDTTSMKALLEAGGADVVLAKIGESEEPFAALRIKNGHVAVRGDVLMPVLGGGKTNIDLFVDARADKFAHVLEAKLTPMHRFTDALLVQGSGNYYHFLVYQLPKFLMLKVMPGDPITVIMPRGWPESLNDILPDLVLHFSGGRVVQHMQIPPGDYEVADVLMPVVPSQKIAAYTSREQVLPLVMSQARAASRALPKAQKLFIRRNAAPNGRNLVNQSEVEAWYVKRGYIPVDPGALPFTDQVLLFARATSIVGVEGAALTNLLFAVNATDVTMLANPATRDETFFSDIAANYAYSFRAIYGEFENPATPSRSANFTVSLQALQDGA